MNLYKSEIHRQVLDETLARYKKRPEYQLRVFLDIYETIKNEAILKKDSRWKNPSEEGKLSVQEHIRLIKLALRPEKPVVIKCNPAVLGAKKPN